ncbi:MAG: oligosaccharide flippase family protein [Candidatus Saccharimonadia bacterium]
MKPLLKATAITGSAFFLNLVVNTLRAKLVAVYLGPSGVAAFAQINAFVTLVITLSSLGVTAAIVRFVAQYKAEKRFHDLKTLIVTCTLFVILASGVTTLVLLILTPEVSLFIFGREALLLLIGISLLNIPISVITNLGVSILQGLKEIRLDAIMSVFSTVVTALLLVVLMLRFGLSGAVVGILLANYVTSAVFFYFLLQSLNKHLGAKFSARLLGPKSQRFDMTTLRPLLGIAVASIIGGGAVNLADILVRSHLISKFGLSTAGSVQPALSFSSQYTSLLSGAVGTYAMPRLSELAHQLGQFRKVYNDYVRLLLILVTPAACGLSILAKYLVPLLYSSKFGASAPLIPYQSVADVLEFAFIGISGALLPLGRGKILLVIGTLIPFVYYLAFRLLIVHIGLRGIPVASGLSWIITGIVTYLVMKLMFNMAIDLRNHFLIVNSVATAIIIGLIANHLSIIYGLPLAGVVMLVWASANIRIQELQAAYNWTRQRLAQ